MNILAILSQSLIGADLVVRLKREGHNVKLFIDSELQSTCLTGMVEKVDDWRRELPWVGKEGLIVFDDVGYGEIQDKLRLDGFSVIGGSAGGDHLELDREFGHAIFSQSGMTVTKLLSFSNPDEAIDFVSKEGGCWVVKQSDHQSTLNYVGMMSDGRDVLSVLENYKHLGIKNISLQQKLQGVEVAVGRFFNGRDWVGPACINFEHKPLFNGNIGPMTGEMGTLMWYEAAEESPLFIETLAKLKSHLQKVSFKGYADINCIVNKDGVWPLEATMRFGCPTIHLQSALQISPWGEFLKALADGEAYDLQYKKEYGIVVSLVVPPFPFFSYTRVDPEHLLEGVIVFLKRQLSDDEYSRLCFQQVRFENGKHRVAGVTGELAFVAGVGPTAEEARLQAYALIDSIIVPKMFYRTDIGEKFISEDKKTLHNLGWIKP
ncbi:MAG: phosphoribosylamine--glycine ligase [Candidatus Moranbacteria bacterium]|jgi:phosphoribosylamine--glycine ligase|nr:phosphoribosylamine--glycine ligase [Candidatus Moranbacteria bacterium]MBP9801183.1 phosphoribosylamine--glycine ligase [Candidatus Moranbacteria bacterium]